MINDSNKKCRTGPHDYVFTCGTATLLKEVHSQYGKLHDLISDCIESGKLSARNLPDDYPDIVDQLIKCVAVDLKVADVLKQHDTLRQ